jgi:1-deoxy-D-xylulose-5-phosphate synthase
VQLAKENPKIVGITAAMPDGTGLDELQKAMPQRFFDVGIAEQHAVTFAAGLATQGFIPVVAIYSTFLQRAFDQIIHDVALQKLHVVFILDRGGLVGADGPTHHGTFDLSYLRMIPDMVVMAPKDESELRDMLYTAILYDKGPVALRFPRGNCAGVPLKDKFAALEIGKGEILKLGKEVGLLAIGNMVESARRAADLLEEEGIVVEVANMRFVRPLDGGLINDIISTCDKIVTVEDNVKMGGFGSGVLEYLANSGVSNVDVQVHGIPDEFVEQGSQAELYALLKLDPVGIADVVRNFLETRVSYRQAIIS